MIYFVLGKTLFYYEFLRLSLFRKLDLTKKVMKRFEIVALNFTRMFQMSVDNPWVATLRGVAEEFIKILCEKYVVLFKIGI